MKPAASKRIGLLALAVLFAAAGRAAGAPSEGLTMNAIHLPPPRLDSPFSVERALQRRRSVREFGPDALTLDDIGQLLWAAQGITHGDGLRTAPSAGALYPLEVIVVAGKVAGLAPGVYAYAPAAHTLTLLAQGDRRAAMADAALGQHWMQMAPATLVFCALPHRTLQKYGTRGIQYVYMETGHAAQNVFLQAAALGLGAAAVGAFEDAQLSRALQLRAEQRPLYLMPVGRPARR